MTGGRGGREHGVLQYPISAKLEPLDFLGFFESPGFYDDCVAAGVDDFDISAVQFGIMANPECGRLISRAGGLRRLVCKNRDSQLIFRVFYAYFDFCGVVVFYDVEAGRDADRFSAEIKDEFRQLIAHERRMLAERSFTARITRRDSDELGT